MDTKQRLNAQIDDLKNRLISLINEDNEKTENRGMLFPEIYQAEQKIHTLEALYSVFSINEENSITEKLDRYTRTTPIMNRFALSEKEFLIIPRAYSIGAAWHHVSLIVKKARGNLSYIDNGLVMTDLKQDVGAILYPGCLSMMSKKSRRYPLYSQLIKLGEFPLNKGNVMPFLIPCRLGGQTYANQTIVGWKFQNGEVIREGTPYGETTTFLIVGILVED